MSGMTRKNKDFANDEENLYLFPIFVRTRCTGMTNTRNISLTVSKTTDSLVKGLYHWLSIWRSSALFSSCKGNAPNRIQRETLSENTGT